MFTRPELELQTYEDLVALRDAKLPPQVYVIATGGCSQMQSTLWKLPGASAFLVGAEFPYNVGATHELLGYMPKKFISPETAMALAEAAYLRALGSMTDGPRVGLGITCSVATTREHRGDHRICAAAISDTQAVYCTHILQKGVGQKQREYDDLIAEILAFKCLFAVTLKKDFVRTPEGFYLEDGHDLARKVFMDWRLVGPTGDRMPDLVVASVGSKLKPVFVPGAFNPPHEGHETLAYEAERMTGREAVYYLTVNPPHGKPTLTTQDMLVRMRGMRGRKVLFSENDPLYIDKARKYPGAAFAIGADAFDRMLDPVWCPVEPMLREFNELGTRFYVRGRLIGDEFADMKEILERRKVPWEFWNIFQALPGRYDISSTQLRGM
jgi:hypothetical protein